MINKNWENDEDIDIGDNVSISTLSSSITLNDGDWNNITIKNENLAVLRDEIDRIIKRIDSDKPSGYMLDGVPIEEEIKSNLMLKTSNDGGVTFHADRLVVKNMLTGEEVNFTPEK